MNTTPYFSRPTYFLSGNQFREKKSSGLGQHINTVGTVTSRFFHENWKRDYILSKGEEYQHFRPLKDPEVADKIMELYESGNFSYEEAGRILNPENPEALVSPDGKPLFKFDKGYPEFDLMRVDFDHLTLSWQNANLDAAQFALALVQTCITQGVPFTIENFERMASDIHEYWAENNNYEGQSARLMTIYKNLPVDTLKNNQKDKDRVHITTTVDNISLPLTEASKNRSIVLNAMQVLFNEYQKDGTLAPEFQQQLADLQTEITRQNVDEFSKFVMLSSETKQVIGDILSENPELTFETFEQMSAVFHANWVQLYGKGQDENLVLPYDQLPVNDIAFNQKQFSRETVQVFLKEMVQAGDLEPSYLQAMSDLTPQIKEQNASDLLKYQQAHQDDVLTSTLTDTAQGDDE